jgi:hypothetical protein
MNKKHKIYDAIIYSKLYLEKFDAEMNHRDKLKKKNKIIGNLQKANHNLKKEINELLNYTKYPIFKVY